MFLAQYSIMS